MMLFSSGLFSGKTGLIIIMLLSTLLILWFGFMALRLRSYIINTLGELSSSIVKKFVIPSDTSVIGGSASGSISGGSNVGASAVSSGVQTAAQTAGSGVGKAVLAAGGLGAAGVGLSKVAGSKSGDSHSSVATGSAEDGEDGISSSTSVDGQNGADGKSESSMVNGVNGSNGQNANATGVATNSEVITGGMTSISQQEQSDKALSMSAMNADSLASISNSTASASPAEMRNVHAGAANGMNGQNVDGISVGMAASNAMNVNANSSSVGSTSEMRNVQAGAVNGVNGTAGDVVVGAAGSPGNANLQNTVDSNGELRDVTANAVGGVSANANGYGTASVNGINNANSMNDVKGVTAGEAAANAMNNTSVNTQGESVHSVHANAASMGGINNVTTYGHNMNVQGRNLQNMQKTGEQGLYRDGSENKNVAVGPNGVNNVHGISVGSAAANVSQLQTMHGGRGNAFANANERGSGRDSVGRNSQQLNSQGSYRNGSENRNVVVGSPSTNGMNGVAGMGSTSAYGRMSTVRGTTPIVNNQTSYRNGVDSNSNSMNGVNTRNSANNMSNNMASNGRYAMPRAGSMLGAVNNSYNVNGVGGRSGSATAYGAHGVNGMNGSSGTSMNYHQGSQMNYDKNKNKDKNRDTNHVDSTPNILQSSVSNGPVKGVGGVGQLNGSNGRASGGQFIQKQPSQQGSYRNSSSSDDFI